jgi:hypothetical protein
VDLYRQEFDAARGPAGAIGALIVRLRREGLFSNSDVEAIVKAGLAGVAPAIGVALGGGRPRAVAAE